ncbi:inner-membrane translocator [Caballeronia fortuita]|uniref:Inner-membrane translocator n=1 Tax=Caballeronia fortuita TaxID=1777138 RepID=A0A158E612_9BURK|nr:ABC transporter permease [Caballeronia fortuita]SAL02278.1 inner-membrane translocator [Caballeronia fortuita]
MPYFEQLLLNGLVIGSIYALAAVAYTLVYGVVKLVNFAFGELFMLGGFLTLTLMTKQMTLFGIQMPMPGLDFYIAGPLAIAGVAALGALIDVVAYRPLRNAPRLAPLITSIAISVLLQSVAQTVWGPTSLRFPPLPVGGLPPLSLGVDLTVTPSELAVFGCAIVAMIGVQFFVSATSLGRAMRAAAQDSTAAYLVGIPVNRIICAAFVLGSALAAFAGILYAQSFQFVSPTMGFVPGLKALTAAVLGGIGSIPGAALGGIILGVAESVCAGYLPDGSVYQDALSFALLVLLLLVRPQGLLGRADLNVSARGSLMSGGGSRRAPALVKMFGSLDRAFAALGRFGEKRVAFGAMAIAVALGVAIRSDYWLSILVMVLVYGMLASGLNIVVGLAGLLDLGFIAFFAIGAYFSSLIFVSVMQNHFGVDTASIWWLFYPNLIVGGLLAALLGAILGYPTLRVRGDYLAIMTLGFGEIVRIVATNWISVTNGPMGVRGIPSPQFFGMSFDEPRTQFFFALALTAIVLFAVARLSRSYVGRAWVALREDEDAAEMMGVAGTRFKLLAYACSGFVGGVVGVFYAHLQQYVSPASFTLFENILVLMLIVLGGLGTLVGPFIGAAIWIVFLQLSLKIPFVSAYPESRYVLLGVLLVALMLFRPEGIAAKARLRLTME